MGTCDVALVEIEDLLTAVENQDEVVPALERFGNRNVRSWTITAHCGRPALPGQRKGGDVSLHGTFRGALPACAEALRSWVDGNVDSRRRALAPLSKTRAGHARHTVQQFGRKEG